MTTNRALEDDRYAEALSIFSAVAEARPDDPEPYFFLGVTSNRTGDYADAQFYLHLAKQKGSQHPDLMFERGWCLMRLGRHRQAAELLKRYEQFHPDRAQTMEFLGRCYLALGLYDEAEVALYMAEKRDPSLRPTVTMARALLEQKRGRTEQTAAQIRALFGEALDAPPTNTLRERFGRAAIRLPTGYAAPDAKRWRLVLSAGIGYTDNVIAASDDVPLPADVSSTDSAIGQFGLLISHDLVRAPRYSIQVGYRLSADKYESQLDEADYQSHYLYADYLRILSDDTMLRLRVSNDYLQIGGSNFRNTVVVRPGLRVQLQPQTALELAYVFTTAEYDGAPSSVTDRDGESHAVSGTLLLAVPDTQLHCEVGAFVTFNDTDGSDYEGSVIGAFVSVAHPLMLAVDGKITYSHLYADYDNNNSFTGSVSARHDDIDVISIELTRPFDMPAVEETAARLYLRYDFTNNDSDVAVFDYDRYVLSTGIVVEF